MKKRFSLEATFLGRIYGVGKLGLSFKRDCRLFMSERMVPRLIPNVYSACKTCSLPS
jgi:hypothetical protein